MLEQVSCQELAPLLSGLGWRTIPLDKILLKEILGIDGSWGKSVHPPFRSSRYVTKSDPEEDPKEYEEDETEDGLVDYPRDWGKDEMRGTDDYTRDDRS
ncbi:hypothetical protein Tco_0455983 [Tanacetum coccineum]